MSARANGPLRVLLVAAATSTAGGGEKHVADLARHLVEAGLDVALAFPGGGDLGELAALLGVTEFEVPISSGFSLGRVAALRRAIAEFEPDVVHAHGSRSAMFARFADTRGASRVVYTVHGIHVDKAGSAARQRVLLAIERQLSPRTAAFVTVAQSDAEKGERLGILDAARTRTIYNGIELPVPPAVPGRFRTEIGVAEHTPLVVSVGRFHEQKDQGTLLQAFSQVVERVPAAHLALVGAGPLEGRLREKATSLGIMSKMTFSAPRAGLADAYTDADVFALSSLWEGLPYVVVEAMAYGTPVVSTGVDGIPEAVADGVTGLLVPSGDAAGLARAASTLLEDPGRARAMGESGRLRVEQRFGLERMVLEYRELYAEVAGGGSRR